MSIGRTYQQLLIQRETHTDLKSINKPKAFTMFSDGIDRSNNHHVKESLKGALESTKLSRLFFSKENVQSIQNNLRYHVYLKTKYILGRQSDDELLIIMRSIFLQYSKNLTYSFTQQIERLNQILLDDQLPRLTNEIRQYVYYLRDRENGWKLNAFPENVSSAGTKQLYPFSGLGI